MKKLVVAARVLMAEIAALRLVSRSDPIELGRPVLARAQPVLVDPALPDSERSQIISVPDPTPRAVIAPPPAAHRLLGRVFDTPGDKPVAGAIVELYASKLSTRDEFERRWAARSQQMYDGWAEPIPIDDPDSRRMPFAGTLTNRDGRFEFELEAGRRLATIGVGAEQASFPFVAPNAELVFDRNTVFEDDSIRPDEDPAIPLRRLDLGLPTRRGSEFSGPETTRVVGRLRWDGQSVDGAQAQISVEIAIPGARLHVTSILTLRGRRSLRHAPAARHGVQRLALAACDRREGDARVDRIGRPGRGARLRTVLTRAPQNTPEPDRA